MRARAAWALAAIGVGLGLALGVAALVAHRTGPPSAATLALVDASGLFDPFLSSSSRWLRHPSVTERAAALADAPDGLDLDPAGLAIRPDPEPRGARWSIVERAR
jgi:hypothetical protein